MSHHAVIMAGGSGTRLWPLSRRDRPKQLLRLFDGRSLLRLSFERLVRLLPAESIHVVTLEVHLPAVAAELPELPRKNLIGEPVGRDTAAAVALSAAVIGAADADAVIGVFTADHLIRPVERFVETVRRGYAAVERTPEALVTFGIRPTHAHTGLGYVQRGAAAAPGVFDVKRFKEKPDEATAAGYLASGEYLWNSGMFVWRAATILEQLRARLPDTHALCISAAAAGGGPAARDRLAAGYPGLVKTSIDFAVMEHAPAVLVVEMDLDWHDVGSWTALPEVLGRDAAGHTATTRALCLDGADNICVAEDGHMIATLGVSDVVVVHGERATLVCRRGDLQRVRELVAEVERRFGANEV